jgi:DNA-binding NarL/FixJ family response regulator
LTLGSRWQLHWPFLARAEALTPLIMVAQTNADPAWCGADGAIHARSLLQRLTAEKRSTTSLFTAREQDILTKLAGNMNNKQMARELDLSPETVRFHLKNIYTKFGIELGYKNRQVVAMLAREQGFLPIKDGAATTH